MACNMNGIPQTYQDAMLRLNEGNSLKVAHNTRLQAQAVLSVSLVYHDTAIITWNGGYNIVFTSGGWRTTATKARLNHVLQRFGIGLAQRQGEWLLYFTGWKSLAVPFIDGESLNQMEARLIAANPSERSRVGTETDYGVMANL